MHSSKGRCVAFLALTFAMCGGVEANLVTNGSFELAAIQPGSNAKVAFTTASGHQPTGWTVASGGNYLFLDGPGGATSTTGGFAVYPGFPSVSPDGGNFIQDDADPTYSRTISQTLTGLSAGSSYVVSFYQAAGQQNNFAGQTTELWKVGFDTTYQLSNKFTLPQGVTGPWEHQSMTFVANSASVVLSFLAVGTPQNQPPVAFLDGVSVELATPEPSSVISVVIGVLGTAAVRLRRRSKTAAV